MKLVSGIALALLACSAVVFAAEKPKSENWTEVFDSPEGKYTLDFDSAQKRVDLTKLDDKTAAPSAVKLRIQRKNDRPLELKLHTMDRPNEPIRYTGHFDEWNGSVAGLEIDFSFDKKTWKKVKNFLESRHP